MYNYLYSRPLWVIVVAMIGSILLWPWLGSIVRTHPKYRRAWKAINRILLLLVLCAILFVTLWRRSAGLQGMELRPFHSFFAARQQPEIYRAMLMNIFLFVPLGLSLSQLLPPKWSAMRRIFAVLLLGFALSVTIEWAQYRFSLGTAETDDVICNSLGALLGLLPILLTPQFSNHCSTRGNRQISRRMDTHGIIVVERFATFHYY